MAVEMHPASCGISLSEAQIQGDSPRLLRKRKGFSLIEVIVGIALVGIALLGLAQFFTYSVMNNARADRMAHATFLAQQQIDHLRSLTRAELGSLNSPLDENIDINSDNTIDFRRVTQIQPFGVSSWTARILVFPFIQGVSVNDLIAAPDQHRVIEDTSTIINREH